VPTPSYSSRRLLQIAKSGLNQHQLIPPQISAFLVHLDNSTSSAIAHVEEELPNFGVLSISFLFRARARAFPPISSVPVVQRPAPTSQEGQVRRSELGFVCPSNRQTATKKPPDLRKTATSGF